MKIHQSILKFELCKRLQPDEVIIGDLVNLAANSHIIYIGSVSFRFHELILFMNSLSQLHKFFL